MNGASGAVAGFGVLCLLLSVTISATYTTGDLNLSSWVFTDEPQLSTSISGTTDVTQCPAGLVDCQAEYLGNVTVELRVVNDSFQITPEVTISEVSIVEVPVEVNSEA